MEIISKVITVRLVVDGMFIFLYLNFLSLDLICVAF